MNSPFCGRLQKHFLRLDHIRVETKESPKCSCILLSFFQKNDVARALQFPSSLAGSAEDSQMVLVGTCQVMSSEPVAKLLKQLFHTVVCVIIRSSSLLFLAWTGLVYQTSVLSFPKSYET